MPLKVRQLILKLEKAGFENRGAKGSHRHFLHPDYPYVVTVSGKSGDDAKPYQEKSVQKAIEELKK